MFRIAICDDMTEFSNHIRQLILSWDNKPEQMAIELFEDGDSLMHSHANQPFDVIFLDIIMPLLNGIETARELRKTDIFVKIIFLTTTSEFAVESYTVKANNYLLKPVSPDKLFACLDECYADIHEQKKYISIRSASTVHRIELCAIDYLEAHGKCVIFSLSNGDMIHATEPFYSYEEKLLFEDGFFKCHRSYIINMAKIDTYSHKELKMASGYRIPISRSCQKEFETVYFEFVFGKAGDK